LTPSIAPTQQNYTPVPAMVETVSFQAADAKDYPVVVLILICNLVLNIFPKSMGRCTFTYKTFSNNSLNGNSA
jgi:hypothetical protein